MDGEKTIRELERPVRLAAALTLTAAALVACTPDGREDGSGSQEDGITFDPPSTTTADEPTTGVSMSGSQTSTESAGTQGPGTADETADGNTTVDPPKFDTATQPDGGSVGCECGGELKWSYLWVANSNESTVSKIDTQTLVEEGRYQTEPGVNGSPSRTSVSLTADAVAVANRNGGVVKVWAREEFCDPMRNGMAGVQTSTGAADVLAFAQEDCIAWHTDFNYTTQRPVAWTSGTQNPVTCEYEGASVWTSGCNTGIGGNVQVHLLDGETGVSMADVDVAGFPCTGFGAYGGAVDSNNDFWISSNAGPSQLARIRISDFTTEVTSAPHWAYGIAVDAMDRVWLTANQAEPGDHAAQRYDPVTGLWDVATVPGGVQGYSGIQEGTDGQMWLNYGFGGAIGLRSIDRDSLVVGPAIAIPGAVSWLNGVSIDQDGNVFTVSPSANAVFRYDPGTGMIDSYMGLNYPYTYSDMTGGGLLNATCGSPVG